MQREREDISVSAHMLCVRAFVRVFVHVCVCGCLCMFVNVCVQHVVMVKKQLE